MLMSSSDVKSTLGRLLTFWLKGKTILRDNFYLRERSTVLARKATSTTCRARILFCSCVSMMRCLILRLSMLLLRMLLMEEMANTSTAYICVSLFFS